MGKFGLWAGCKALPAMAVFVVVLSLAACSHQSSSTVASQQTKPLPLKIQAQIFSSVPKNSANKSCTMDCELVLTGGSSGTTLGDQTFSAVPLLCDGVGNPGNGQTIEETIDIDPTDPLLKTGGNVEFSCTPAGGNFLSVYSDSVSFSSSICLDGGPCLVNLELTNVLDSLGRSGFLDFLTGLSCTTLIFLSGQCEQSTNVSSLTCNLVGLSLSLVECPGGAGDHCGNGICEAGEDDFNNVDTFCFNDCACKGNLAKGGGCECENREGCLSTCAGQGNLICGPNSLPDNLNDIRCSCQNCGNGIFEPDLGEGCDPSDPHGVDDCFSKDGTCDGTTCECFSGTGPCGNRIVEPELGEECDTGLVFPYQQGTCQEGFVCISDQCKCSQCGNFSIDPGEQCDAGGFIGQGNPDPVTGKYACSAFGADWLCNHLCQCTQCGNGTVDPGEECDVNGDLAHWTFACSQLGFCPDNCQGCQ